MAIIFDPAKRQVTLATRGLDFLDADRIFAGLTATVPDTRTAYLEPRFITAGILAGRVVVVWTPSGADRRVISMRYAHAKESRVWQSRMV